MSTPNRKPRRFNQSRRSRTKRRPAPTPAPVKVTASLAELASKAYLTRSELAEFLTCKGYPISRSTLDKFAMLSHEGDRLMPDGVWGRRVLYEPGRALAWATQRFSTSAAAIGFDIVPDPTGDGILFFEFELPALVSRDDLRAFGEWLASSPTVTMH